MLKKIILSIAATVCMLPIAAKEPLISFPSAVPIHLLASANIAAYIGTAIAKAGAYKKLRATLINQLENEAVIEADQEKEEAVEMGTEAVVRQPKQNVGQMIAHITTASKQELIRIASEIVQQRKMYEQTYGEFALIEKIGSERNAVEKATIFSYEELIKKIFRYEILQPQLGMALIGTGAATAFTALRQFGVIG